MNSTILLRKLIAIERMVGKTDNNTLRSLIYEAEDYLIQMQSTQAKSFLAEAWREGVAPAQVLARAPHG
ncbi:MAG TPA: hypothetical protein VMT38_03650 [Terracidiphilus sp.]|nr:hypothetical protein [Terracidiphilus sp.]